VVLGDQPGHRGAGLGGLARIVEPDHLDRAAVDPAARVALLDREREPVLVRRPNVASEPVSDANWPTTIGPLPRSCELIPETLGDRLSHDAASARRIAAGATIDAMARARQAARLRGGPRTFVASPLRA
jgi:hypothetical protein